MSRRSIVAIDQGTTSTRALRFDAHGSIEAIASRELAQAHPQPGWVEQEPEDIWRDTLAVLREVLTDDVAALGIANQRETVILWDRRSGRALHPAIVWQDRRTAAQCDALREAGAESVVRAKTGLLLDPYFSATKLAWLLDQVPRAREQAARGELAAGTIDAFLLWRLTAGRVHATDVTNASRTLLYDIRAHAWDGQLLKLFDIPVSVLPRVYANTHEFGITDAGLVGRALPIAGMAGDQQAALIGQGCFEPGTIKSTYGTGCFMLANIGAAPVLSGKRLLTTPAYRIGSEDAYALEGSIFVAGAAVKWLRDTMGLIASANETAQLAASVTDDHGVHLIPAFVGLGAPHWRSDLRASISGITFDTSRAHLVRAALESVVFQTCDLIEAMTGDGEAMPSLIRIDGGMAVNDWFAQFLADMLALPVERPANHESTALGAAWLAGATVGLWDRGVLMAMRQSGRRFAPSLAPEPRTQRLHAWRAAVRHALAPEATD